METTIAASVIYKNNRNGTFSQSVNANVIFMQYIWSTEAPNLHRHQTDNPGCAEAMVYLIFVPWFLLNEPKEKLKNKSYLSITRRIKTSILSDWKSLYDMTVFMEINNTKKESLSVLMSSFFGMTENLAQQVKMRLGIYSKRYSQC